MIKRTKSREHTILSNRKIRKNGCWEFTGYISTTGYGRISFTKKKCDRKTGKLIKKTVWLYVHRVSYSWYRKPIPKGMFVCHKCDNPLCFNPKHLFIGTHQDNMDDMVAKGRHIGNREITEKDAVRIRKKLHKGVHPEVVATEYALCVQHVRAIWDGKFWPNAGGPIRKRKPRYTKQITQEIADKVRRMKGKGKRVPDIAKQLSIGVTTVYQIANGSYKVIH